MPSVYQDQPDKDSEPFVEINPTGTVNFSDLELSKKYTEHLIKLRNFSDFCTSGNLREYRKKHRQVSMKALKKWSKQILEGLDYLRNHDPCIIRRDLNCSNVSVNGNTGQVKIGDLGLAAIVGKSHSVHSILGTPEFMAPELYKKHYTELVDIYSLGFSTGVRPQAMSKITDEDVKAFIERCLAQLRARPSAVELLKDPFFNEVDNDDDDDDDDKISSRLKLSIQRRRIILYSED
ncbi:putative serine/threonine-protein kinase WNK5 [Hibiscus syriacus]|uniref:non-specific serine/threonine protein kinase n=1 Tax=Hibiscus syriacus TaxID=106335 RepID=A0A6A3D1B8_HIBSY|nr:putative serine/threonine-protein kinase WNK5 [Hibiscus syriacus]